MKSETDLLGEILEQLQVMSRQIKGLAQQFAQESPNYQRPLGAFVLFDWSSIGAEVRDRDRFGPSIVEWNGYLWTRRSGSGKFGDAIWFSRATGTGEAGTEYARLVTFKDNSAPEPLPEPVVGKVANRNGGPAGTVEEHEPEPWDESPAARTYGNGQPVPEKNWRPFDAYVARHGQPPRDYEMLRAWATAQVRERVAA